MERKDPEPLEKVSLAICKSTSLLLSSHVMLGMGYPLAPQERENGLVMVMFCSTGCSVISGATVGGCIALMNKRWTHSNLPQLS